jgi:hypothetical protein
MFNIIILFCNSHKYIHLKDALRHGPEVNFTNFVFAAFLQSWNVPAVSNWHNQFNQQTFTFTLYGSILLRTFSGAQEPYLRSAFTPIGPKIVRIQSSCQYLFTLLGSSGAKAALWMLMKLSPGVLQHPGWKRLIFFVRQN